MVKIVKRLFFLYLVGLTFLFGSNLRDQTEALVKKIPFASKTQNIQICHNLKNLYISSIVAEDKQNLKTVLKGLIQCSKRLSLDTKEYEQELYELSPKPKTSTKITSIAIQDSTLILTFNKNIQSKDIIFFELNDKNRYKDIYDIKANLPDTYKRLSLKGVDEIKIAQNRYEKTRLVLQNKTPIDSKSYIKANKLFIKIRYKAKPKQTYTPKPIIKTTKNSIFASSKTIVIDPGHGGKDPGAIGYKKYEEKDSVLKIAQYLKKELQKRGYKVYLTRYKDQFVSLHDRTSLANRKNADLFLSIHANAAPKKSYLSMKGVETFFLSPAKTDKAKAIAAKENASVITNMNAISKDTLLSFLNRTRIIQSNKLAIDIQSGILSSVRKKYDNVIDGGVREAPFWVLVGAQMPAILIEIGYITNPTEAQRLFNPFYQRVLAKGIANGIDNYFIKNQ